MSARPPVRAQRGLASFSDPAGNLVGLAQHGGDSAGRGNRTMPSAVVMPVLVYDDVPAAIDWLCAAFGFSERWRVAEHRAVLEFDGGAVMLGDADATTHDETSAPARRAAADHGVMVRVDDVDAHCDRARGHGARVTDDPQEFPYGERQYNVIDLGGHAWTFTQSVADVAPEDWGGTPGPALRR